MDYFLDVYPRFYDAFCSGGSWMIWFIIFACIGTIVGITQDSKNEYRKRILYLYIIFLVSSVLIRLLMWVFLPSPKYFGLV